MSAVFVDTVRGEDRLHVKFHRMGQHVLAAQRFTTEKVGQAFKAVGAAKKSTTASSTKQTMQSLWFSGGEAADGGEDGGGGGGGTDAGEDVIGGGFLGGADDSDGRGGACSFCVECFRARVPQRAAAGVLGPLLVAELTETAAAAAATDDERTATTTQAAASTSETSTEKDTATAVNAVLPRDRWLRRLRRLDFVLQAHELEVSTVLAGAEYLSALQAHTAYFECPDVAKFILDTIAHYSSPPSGF